MVRGGRRAGLQRTAGVPWRRGPGVGGGRPGVPPGGRPGRGQAHRSRKAIVNAEALAKVAEELDVGHACCSARARRRPEAGRSARSSRTPSRRSSAPSTSTVGPTWRTTSSSACSVSGSSTPSTPSARFDHKTALQELAVRLYDAPPLYRMRDEGPTMPSASSPRRRWRAAVGPGRGAQQEAGRAGGGPRGLRGPGHQREETAAADRRLRNGRARAARGRDHPPRPRGLRRRPAHRAGRDRPGAHRAAHVAPGGHRRPDRDDGDGGDPAGEVPRVLTRLGRRRPDPPADERAASLAPTETPTASHPHRHGDGRRGSRAC